jgi:hypothetical protein
VDVNNIVTIEKRTSRTNPWGVLASNITPAISFPHQPPLYEASVDALEAEPQRKHSHMVLYNADATAASPLRIAFSLPQTQRECGHVWQTSVLLGLGPLANEATAWRSVILEHEEAPSAVRQEVSASQRRVSRLVGIQAIFGFPVQTLATILHISRPTLYKWLDVEDEVQPQADNRERLMAVERIAKQWRVRSSSPLSSVAHEPIDGARTVIDLLTVDELDERDIVGALDELVAKLRAKPKSLSQKMTAAGYTRRPSMRSVSDDE